jgi:hypothetical protein
MRRAAIVLVAWGIWLGVWTGAQAAFRSIKGPFGVHWIEAVLLGSAAAASVLVGLALWALDSHNADADAEPPRALTSDSFATATLCAGLALALLGAGFGLWLILIGAGVAALGAGGLVREERARRRRQGDGGAT